MTIFEKVLKINCKNVPIPQMSFTYQNYLQALLRSQLERGWPACGIRAWMPRSRASWFGTGCARPTRIWTLAPGLCATLVWVHTTDGLDRTNIVWWACGELAVPASRPREGGHTLSWACTYSPGYLWGCCAVRAAVRSCAGGCLMRRWSYHLQV